MRFLLNSHEDHLNYYYRVDNHWRVNAIVRAYHEIHALLSENYPDITQPLQITNTIQFPEINFLGMMARRTLFPVRGDEFVVEDVAFPAHDLIESGRKIENDRRSIYFEGKYSTIPYINHYNAFYDAKKGNKEEAYICECQRKSLENRIYMFSHVMKDHMLNDFIINKSYIPSRNIKQFLGFPSSISSKIDFSKNIISQLKFKDHICHKCNKVIPKMSEGLMNIENKRNNEIIDWAQYFENYLVENGLYTRYSYDAKDTRCNNGFFQRELMRKDIRERFSVDFSMYNELINGVDKKTRSVFDELFNTEEKFYFFS